MKISKRQPEPGTAAFQRYMAYLAGIQRDDTVVICSGRPHYKLSQMRVTDVREKQCFASGFWFSTVHGSLLTRAPIKHYLLEPTEALLAHLRREACVEFLSGLHQRLLLPVPDQTLQDVCDMLQQALETQVVKSH